MRCPPPRSLLAHYQPLASHLQSVLNRPVRPVAAPDATQFGQRIPQAEYDPVLAQALSAMDVHLEPRRRALMLSSAGPGRK
jgi:ABC-type phosphate/phosphonate transport system substrate-binding protein